MGNSVTERIGALAQQIVALSSANFVPAGTSLQSAINAAPVNATLVLDDGVFNENIVFPDKPLRLMPLHETDPVRVDPSKVATWITGGPDADTLTVPGKGVSLMGGLGIKNQNPARQLVGVTGNLFLMDRVALLGDPVKGCHRGLMPHGQDAHVSRCYVDDIFSIGRDSQAICAWDGMNSLYVSDCYLAAAGETVLFGGADSLSSDRIPRNFFMWNCTLSKKQAWYTNGSNVKNAFEIKSLIGGQIQDCIFEYGGRSEGQGGYLIVLTPRNQNGTAPWSCIQDITFDRCLGRNAGAGINILGTDDTLAKPSGPLSSVTFRNVKLQLDPSKYSGTGHAVFMKGGDRVAFDGITVEGANLAHSVYVDCSVGRGFEAPTNLSIKNFRSGPSAYGFQVATYTGADGKTVSGGLGPAYMAKRFTADIQVTPLTPQALGTTDVGAVGTP